MVQGYKVAKKTNKALKPKGNAVLSSRQLTLMHTLGRLKAVSNSLTAVFHCVIETDIIASSTIIIRESVDSLCRDDADMPMPPYIRKAYNCPNAAFVSLFRWLTVILECFST